MKPRTSSLLHGNNPEDHLDWTRQHSRVLSGNVSFGQSSTDTGRNIDGYWVLGLVTPGSANTEFQVPYSLPNGRVAIAFDVKRTNKAASIYDSGTAWSSSTIFLKCSVASVTVSLFIH